MIEEGRAPPHGILLAVVVILVMAGPGLIGDSQAITEAISNLVSPVGLPFLPIILLLAIRFLSSDRASVLSRIFYPGEQDSIHRISGSPIGVGLFLLVLMCLVYYRISFSGSDGDSGD
ncbi:hypothetical protein Nepgr_031149 [Nepenthes gracilis]|uniref:Uncharacterized protein n=1 Tax=Nepenthes gracilis TaxID=150966 RepID=A0AAD3THJ9_NEPGR|nr:hypothetical protein Nepgr_031149 [Nepenthes gracilis]